MGGIGSGRHWYYSAKDTTDSYHSIDVRCWKKEGLLTAYQTFDWQWSLDNKVVASIQVQTDLDKVVLSYRHKRDGTWKDATYPIKLEWVACNFGGDRPWFLCPAQGCGRRVAILYSGSIFACRKCHQLAYSSQSEASYERAARRADKIRTRLSWQQGILNPKEWKKPKGMHWRTFERLNTEHDISVEESLTGIAAWLKHRCRKKT